MCTHVHISVKNAAFCDMELVNYGICATGSLLYTNIMCFCHSEERLLFIPRNINDVLYIIRNINDLVCIVEFYAGPFHEYLIDT